MDKPKKPHPDFPLSPHGSGQWSKRIHGKLHYFGSWRNDPDGLQAVQDYERRLPWILKGREPPVVDSEAVTVRYLINQFLARKDRPGEVSARTFERYKKTGEIVRDYLGAATKPQSLSEESFEGLRKHFAGRFGPVALNNELGMVRAMFLMGQKRGWVDRQIDLHDCLDRPSAKLLRAEREKKKTAKLFKPAEIRKLLKAAPPNVKAMILLGIQAGMGNSDVARLPLDAAKGEKGWLVYTRAKTGIVCRIPLWKETTDALAAVVVARRPPKKKEDAGLLFIGARGANLIGGGRGSEVSDAFDVVMRQCGLSGRTFYDLRRNFQTVAKQARNSDAVKALMGHAAPESDMSDRYTLAIEDSELRRVVNVVHQWVFGRG